MAAPSITAMPTSIQSPSLPPDWAPNTASCLFSTDYWIWDYGSAGDAPTVLGGPSQTTACLPTGWGADVLYSGTACPSLYTPGCPESNGVVTCCPDTYDFTCVSNDFKPDNHGSVIRCVTPYTTQDVVKVTRTVFHNSQRTAAFETRSTGNHLFALAVMYTTPPSTDGLSTVISTLSTTGPSTTTSSSTSAIIPSASAGSSGLSPGAAAGIGVGAAVAAVLLGLLIWFLYRRWKASVVAAAIAYHPATTTAPTTTATPVSWFKPSAETPGAYTDMTEGSNGPPQHQGYPPARPVPGGLATNSRQFELEGALAHELA